MTEIERWIETHDLELHDLAERMGAHDDTVHFLAALVLGGASDDEIYEHLRTVVPSMDGQRSPLAGAPELVTEVRRLVAAP
jgi:hypothetical protein